MAGGAGGAGRQTRQVSGALRANQEQTNRFLGVVAGTVPAADFFALDNLGAIIGAAEWATAA